MPERYLAKPQVPVPNADPLRTSRTRIATPSGKIGYAAPDTLASLAAPQLCYVKDVTGRWAIAGFIGKGN